MHDTSLLKESAVARLPELVAILLPHRHVQYGRAEIRVGNRGSLSVIRATGIFCDHETGIGGDIIELIKYARQCSFLEAIEWLQAFIGSTVQSPAIPRGNAKPKPKTDTSPIAARIWRESVPIVDTLAEYYLHEVRGISLSLADCASLRFHPALYHKDTQQKHPAMVAAFADSAGKFQAIHRTYLADSGEKLTGVDAKAMLGSTKGGAIRLFPTSHSLALAEGIENAFSYMQLYGAPCWATGSTSNLQSVILPVGITHITIAADNDDAGIQAAQTAARHFMAEGRTLQILTPPDGVNDFNDMLQKKKADAATPATLEKELTHE